MKIHVYYVVLVAVMVMTIGEVSATKALTETEIQLLQSNSFTVTIDEEGGTITLEHAGIPNHDLPDNWGNNPNEVQQQDHSFTLPLNATIAENEPGCAGGLGPIGFAISGAVFYNPYTAFGWNAVEGECAEDLDTCWGHPSPHGTYHYHQVPECLYNISNPDLDLRDMFLGVALDGYPIYGPMNGTNHNYTSADLDQCHGHTYNGRYMYRATFDFPYIISCFHGRDVNNTGNPDEDQTEQQQQPEDEGQNQQRGGRPGGGRPPGGGDRGPPPDGGGRGPPEDGTSPDSGPSPSVDTPQDNDANYTDPCMRAEEENWQALTCIVVCENAGRNLSNCPSPSNHNTNGNTTGNIEPNTGVDSALSVVPSLGLVPIMCCFFAMVSFFFG